MKCPNCDDEIPIGQRFCPHCGKRVEVTFDDITHSVRVDAASARGKRLEDAMKFAVALLVTLIIVAWLYNDYVSVTPVADVEGYIPSPEAPELAGASDMTPLDPLAPLPLPTVDIPSANIVSPPRLGHRRGRIKEELITARGGDKRTKAAVAKGLQYLAFAQAGRLGNKKGGWSVKGPGGKSRHGDEGITGLALLAFLSDGQVWVRDSAGKKSRHGAVVKRGVYWLVSSQDADGLLADRIDPKFNYSHGMATAAVAEAYAASGDARLRSSVEKATRFIIKSQRPSGGWDYRDKPGNRADVPITGWQITALAAARRSGVEVPDKVFEKAIKFFDAMTAPSTGQTGYDEPPGRGTSLSALRPNQSTTAISLRCRQLAGLPQDRRILLRQAAFIRSHLPSWSKSWPSADVKKRVDLYYWYNASEGLFMLGPSHWRAWNAGLKRALVSTQDAQGYWPNHTKWGKVGGMVYTTSMAVLCLTTYYRHP